MSVELAIALVTALATVSTVLVAWRQSKNHQATVILGLEQDVRRLKADHGSVTVALDDSKRKLAATVERLNASEEKAKRYEVVREHLRTSRMVRKYYQPVLLLGPKGVGKTSLLAQWHSPWTHASVAGSMTRRIAHVPIFEFTRKETEPHFADESIRVAVDIQLALRVHDYPGELSAQAAIRNDVIAATAELVSQVKKAPGIVLICMLDAEEAAVGTSVETQSYFNGELFRDLRDLVAEKTVEIARMVIVLNKHDKLRARVGSESTDAELLERCRQAFAPIFRLLKSICHPARVCEVFTVLERERLFQMNRGAPIVLGEASRAFVEAMAGEHAVRKPFDEKGPTLSAPSL